MIIKQTIHQFKFMIYFYIILLFFIALIIIEIHLSKREESRINYLEKIYKDSNEKRCVVKLVALGSDTIQIIRNLKEFTFWDLTTAMNKIQLPMPIIISYDMPLSLAINIKEELAKLNTIIEIHQI